MTDNKPIISLSALADHVEGDCACPDVGCPPQVRLAEQGDAVEQDCACPDANPSLPSPPLSAGLWRRSPDLYRARLPEQHEIVFNPGSAAAIAVLNAPASRILDAFALPRDLAQVAALLSDLDAAEVSSAAQLLASSGLIESAGE